MYLILFSFSEGLMVQLMNSGTDKIPGTKRLKKEVEDSLEDLLDQFHKRSKSEVFALSSFFTSMI